MNVWGIPVDLYWILQFVGTAVVIALGLLHLVKSTASRYFVVDANFDEGEGEGSAAGEGGRRKSQEQMLAVARAGGADCCAGCGSSANKKCSGCKAVRYCSENCQSKHWKAGHRLKCKELKLSALNSRENLVNGGGNTAIQQIKKVLFPYEEFTKLFNWEGPGLPPCGLLNCGNSCFANVVLQCLSCTRPLVAYLLEKDHRRECRRNDWCFFCELQTHIQRARQSLQPFSPLNILSRLPNIGGNLGYGKQEDAHEFMRFAIDTMQSVCLDEFGGEKSLHPSSQETTLLQYIFGGHLQSQVTCTKCEKISYRNENMMDLTVEIQGDVASLENCLDQFTAQEWLDGENMYKCDGCNDYVKACKRLTICRAPNVLTIALKRFQSGRFGKLNKRVSFPETLKLSPYMSKLGDGPDLYRLYAVVVHIDMLNASFFGHYICYTKDFDGNWYRIDDYKVSAVDLEEVLSQGAYMLLYCRTSVRPSYTNPLETSGEEQQLVKVVGEDQPCSNDNYEQGNSLSSIPSGMNSTMMESFFIDSVDMDQEVPVTVKHLSGGESQQDHDPINTELNISGSEDFDIDTVHSTAVAKSTATTQIVQNLYPSSHASSLTQFCSMESEVSSSTGSDVECSLVDSNGSGGNFNKGLLCPEPKDDCLPIERDFHGMAEKPRSDDNLKLAASFSSVPNHRLEQEVAVQSVKQLPAALDKEVKISQLDVGGPGSRSKLKPLFSPGFLDKSTRCKPVNINEKAQVGPHKVGRSCKLVSDSSGLREPSFPSKGSSEVGDNHGALDLDCQRSQYMHSNKFLNGDGYLCDQPSVDCRYDNLHAAGVDSSGEIACEAVHSPHLLTDFSSVDSNGLKHEINESKFDGSHCINNGNGFAVNELEASISLSGENSSHEMKKFSVPVVTFTAVNKSNLSLSSHLQNPRLDQQVACFGGELIKLPFQYQNRNGSQMEICENGASDCNEYVNSAFLHPNNHRVNDLDGIFLDHNSQSTSGFMDTRDYLDEDRVINDVLDETGKKPIYCNGNAGSIADKDKKISLLNRGFGTVLENDETRLAPPSFYDRSVKKKSLEDDAEGRDASDIVLSVQDRTKLPRVG